LTICASAEVIVAIPANVSYECSPQGEAAAACTTSATSGFAAKTKQIVLKEIQAKWGKFPALVTQPDQARPPRATFAGIPPRPQSGDNAPGMQAWRGNDRQETVNFKPLIFSEIHAAGDTVKRRQAEYHAGRAPPLDASVTGLLWLPEELVGRTSSQEVHAIEFVYLDRNLHWLNGRRPDPRALGW